MERDQQYLMPVSMRDWLPEDDLAWFVIEAVDQLDLAPLRARYRSDGWGAPAYDPAMMTALLLYAYATGERSSRRIEARCQRDVAYRVICANAIPDHATIARFRAEHEEALAGLFGEVLRLCAAAGLGRLGLVALDGTRISANASLGADRRLEAIDAQIALMLAEAAATDAAEDQAHGPDRRGDELPAELADPRSRLARFSEARRQLAEIEAQRAEREATIGRRAGGRLPGPDGKRHRAWAERNTTDPDARRMKGAHGWVTGYNAQALVAADGIVLATGLTQSAADVEQLAPMLETAERNVERAGYRGRIGTLVADGGYWSEANAALERRGGTRLLIAPTSGPPRTSHSTRPPLPLRDRMRRRLARRPDADRYRRRKVIAEPLFGHVKEILGVRRFQRRGFAACEREWTFVCTGVNLVKLWRHGSRSGRGGPSDPPGPAPLGRSVRGSHRRRRLVRIGASVVAIPRR